MSLLDAVVAAGEGEIRCSLTVASDGLFDREGEVPAWLGLEYMAQAVAALAGWEARQRGQPPAVGFLLGSRQFTTSAGTFPCGARLDVSASRLMQADNGTASFHCELQGQGINQSARLTVYVPRDLTHYLEHST